MTVPRPRRTCGSARLSFAGFALLLAVLIVGCDDGADEPSIDLGDADTAVPDDAADDASLGDVTLDAAIDGDAPPSDLGSDARTQDAVPDIPPPGAWRLTGEVRFHEIQAKGTHNSYHLEPETLADPSHAYSHAPLSEQLDAQGVRQFELDLHLHRADGWQVFHLGSGVDPETTCLAFDDCLREILDWSLAHPGHVPIMIWIEPKDLDLDWADSSLLEFVSRNREIDDAILEVVPRSRVFTPDDLRGVHPDLPTAVRADGWPTLDALRDRMIFSLLDSSEHRDNYVGTAQNLAGRLLFVDADTADDPFAAMFKINDARGEAALVGQLASEGFVVTSNVDSADWSDDDNAAKSAASAAAGAHFLSSDFPAPVAGRDYAFELPGGSPRCNPVSASDACVDGTLEPMW